MSKRRIPIRIFTLLSLVWSLPACGQLTESTASEPAEAIIAVATNFKSAALKLIDDFQHKSPHTITLVSGSTGKLYAQILNGAPYDLFLAADQVRPNLLEQQGFAIAGSQTTYATGQLVLLGRKAVDKTTLLEGQFAKLALANPKLAPYGQAAMEVLQTLGLAQKLRAKLVFGQNVGQAYTLVSTGNAALGFVAAAQLNSADIANSWFLPGELHKPIHQDFVILKRARDNLAAVDFSHYLTSSADARNIITNAGYVVVAP